MIPRFMFCLLVFAALHCPNQQLFAGGGPENVAVIVNANSETSKLIANHYVRLRQIPPRNVIYLNQVPDEEQTSFSLFKSRILVPIVEEIQARNLGKQIDYVVYSADFPTAVKIGSEKKKLMQKAKEAGVRLVDPKALKPVASINSLTYFMQRVLSENQTYISLEANSYMRTRNLTLLSQPFYGSTQEDFEEALRQTRNGKHDEAIEILESLAKKHPTQIAVSYWLARVYAAKQDAATAAQWLTLATKTGWSFRDYTKLDRAFTEVLNDPAFRQAVADIPNQSFKFLPSMAFRSGYRWGRNGMINGTVEQGESYMLSTVLAATRSRGTSEKEALKQITRSVKADGTHPAGTFYFATTSDVRTKTRRKGITNAIKELEELGQKSELVSGKLPARKKDIAGLCIGTATFDFTSSRNKILAGAICENLTSYGGRLSARGQTPLTEFIRFGAAGSSGTVVEPLALQAKFPDPRVHVHYVNGCSLAESFYQSVHGPFQLLIVGDALCQPWAVFPKFTVNGIAPGETVSGIEKLEFDFSMSPVNAWGVEYFMDGKLVSRIPATKGFSFDTADIADGYHEMRIVAVAEHAAQTKSRVIIPFFVSNDGDQITLKRDVKPVAIEETIQLTATANCGDKIHLLHNGRVLSSATGQNATFEIPAKRLGRGPVQLFACAQKKNQRIYSNPISFQVDGKISDARIIPPTPPKKPAITSKKPARKKPAGANPKK